MPKLLRPRALLKELWNGYSDDVGKSLIHLGATGWFFSALAQIGMIASNDNIEKKEKRFLIPQEITDGVINVTLYYTVCQGIKHVGEFIVENGKILTSEIANFMKKLEPNVGENYVLNINKISNAFRSVGLVNSNSKNNITDIVKGTIEYLRNENTIAISSFNREFPKIAEQIKNNFSSNVGQSIDTLKTILQNFKKFKNGIGVLTAISASVLACNIITPVFRNISANYFQSKLTKNKTLDKKNHPMQNQPLKITYSPVFNSFKI